MKYQVFDATIMEKLIRYVTVLISEGSAKTFPADIGQSDYDQFLVDAQLTDEQVKALKPDVWYDFPKASK